VFPYYLELALRSLRRNAVLTALMIAAIGVGIGASMTTLTVFRAMSGDPIPAKSRQLFTPQIQNRGPDHPDQESEDGLPTSISYIDAMAWMRAGVGKRQTATYATWLSVRPADPKQKPFKKGVRVAYNDFFTMFEVPFQYGGAWTRADDDNRAAVVVLTRAINDSLFGGANSVGKTIRLDNETYRVVGVLKEWLPIPRFYDLQNVPFGESDQLLIPFTRAIDRQMTVSGSMSCTDESGAAFSDLLKSNCIWLQFWVELPTHDDVAKYRAYLANYAADQQHSGRFGWVPRTQLRDVREWLAYRHVVPNEVNILILLSFGFLSVCLLNAAGLMLAKLMGRAGEIGVRRALGASRMTIFVQCLIETGVVGLSGGLLGLGLTMLGLAAARALVGADFVALMHLDVADVGIAIGLSLTATLLAGLYPTWRAAQVQPAWQLKAP
jgi:putative ABC transport system permease protein